MPQRSTSAPSLLPAYSPDTPSVRVLANLEGRRTTTAGAPRLSGPVPAASARHSSHPYTWIIVVSVTVAAVLAAAIYHANQPSPAISRNAPNHEAKSMVLNSAAGTPLDGDAGSSSAVIVNLSTATDLDANHSDDLQKIPAAISMQSVGVVQQQTVPTDKSRRSLPASTQAAGRYHNLAKSENSQLLTKPAPNSVQSIAASTAPLNAVQDSDIEVLAALIARVRVSNAPLNDATKSLATIPIATPLLVRSAGPHNIAIANEERLDLPPSSSEPSAAQNSGASVSNKVIETAKTASISTLLMKCEGMSALQAAVCKRSICTTQSSDSACSQ